MSKLRTAGQTSSPAWYWPQLWELESLIFLGNVTAAPQIQTEGGTDICMTDFSTPGLTQGTNVGDEDGSLSRTPCPTSQAISPMSSTLQEL